MCRSVLASSYILVLLLCCASSLADDWHHPLYLDGGAYWRQRVPVQVHNETAVALAGHPVSVAIGNAAGEAALAGERAAAIRVCDARGTELRFALYGPDGDSIVRGQIPDGSTLVIPAECPPNGTATFYVYSDNKAAGSLPDFLNARTRLANGDVESGVGDTPAGWRHDRPDAQHRAIWTDEDPQSGRRCLKTVVADGAELTWIATRQHGIRIIGGARYRLRAWVRGENVHGMAGWYLHVGNRENSMMMAPTLSAGDGTFDWKQVSTEFTAPDDADRISLGTVLRGTGTAWFDNVTLDCLSPGRIRAKAGPVESIRLREVGMDAPWFDDKEHGAFARDHRAAVNAMNLRDSDLGPAQVSVDLWRLEARMRGRLNRQSIVVTLDGKPVAHSFFGDQLLFEANLPARSLLRYYVYFSGDPRVSDGNTKGDAVVVDEPSNLVRNAGFETGEGVPAGWTTGIPLQNPHGVTFALDMPGRHGLGRQCAKMHVPLDAPKTWRGWHQDVPVQPGRSYLLSAWVKCEDVNGGEVRVHAHRRTATGGLSAHSPFLSVGPGIAGTTDWQLMTGAVTIPEDTVRLQLHLTMEQSGTVWHDNVCVTEIVPGTIVRLEGRPGAQSDPLAVWQVPAVVKVFQDDPAPRDSGAVEIAAARNEREPLQLAVRAVRAIAGMRIEVDPPVAPNGFRLDDIDICVARYVPIDHPTSYYQSDSPAWHRKMPTSRGGCDGWAGMWPDPLVPQETFDAVANTTQPIWITFAVPKNAPEGDYAGKVRVTSPDGLTAEVPFRVHVWDFALPDESHVAAIYDVRLGPGAALWGKSTDEMYSDIIRFMASRRLCPDTIRPAPSFRRQNGRITADFGDFDKVAEVYFDQLKFPFAYTPWSLYLFGWGHPPKTIFGERPYGGEPPYDTADRNRLRPEYKRVYQDMLKLFWDHLKEKGWDEKVILYISDEPFDRHQHIRDQMKALCEMIHEVDCDIPIYSSTWKHVPDWDGYLDVWGIGHYGRVAPEKMAELRAAGDRLWYTTDGQMCTDTPYCAVERLLPHYCFKYGVEAYEFWGVGWLTYDPFRFGWHSYIHQSSEPGSSYWIRYPNGDGFLLYPGAAIGREGLTSSIRFEQAREGVEDYEYLHLLNQLVTKAKATGADATKAQKALASAKELVEIPNAGGRYSTKILPDPEALYRVRRQLAEAIESMGK